MAKMNQYERGVPGDFFSDFEAWAARPAEIDIDTLGWDPYGREAA